MDEIKLTVSQQAVVDNRGGPLLVSAAAGSGKTKVLVDRLLAQICDPEAPCNIDDFLVITYTNAAAAELRLKIAQALNHRLSKEPDNRHLQRQLHRIYLANISTVHAFCANLLRTYAYLLDIPADFRMAEEVESTILQDKVLDRLLEEAYEEGSEDFLLMVDTFGYGRDDRRLSDAIRTTYQAMRCRVDMDQWLDSMMRLMEMEQYDDVAQTPWGEYLIREFKLFLTRQIENFRAALKEMEHYPAIQKGYAKVFEENVKQMEKLLSTSTWEELTSSLISSFGRISPIRKPEDESVKDRLSKIRSQCWSELKEWQGCFCGNSQENLDNLRSIMPAAQALLRFTKRFDTAYTEEKCHRRIMDFSDLEHSAIRLLVDKYTHQPTKIAQEISKKYVEIMVDEYQDSNQVQDIIFEAVSRHGLNRFMVGDVKQSIYRFRLADPTLFLEKYETYPLYTQAQTGEPRKILLSENFRSRSQILSACNDVFRLIMRKQVGDLDYGENEALHPGRSFPTPKEPPVELHCLTVASEEAGVDKREREAQYVAKRVRELLDTPFMVTEGEEMRPCKPKDIVILMRSLSNTAPVYVHALEQLGISAVCSREGSMLESTEIQILIAMLHVIDNPHQDVPLLTVLASPVFCITPDQLAQARIKEKQQDVYDFIRSTGQEFQPFLTCLQQLREEARWITLHELIDRIFVLTEMRSVFSAMHDGDKRRRNLEAFRSYVVSFEGNGGKALPQLLWQLEDLRENGRDLPVPSVNAENAVTIMSVHKSKGLEFPIVILSDLSHQFSRKDMQEAILVDDALGIGCNYVDQRRYIRYPTIAKQSIQHKKEREALSEELRILYVAMTRAKEKMIMTYYSKNLLSELSNINSRLTMPLSDDLCSSVNNPGKWILMAALCRTEAGALLNLVGGNQVSQVQDDPWDISYHDLTEETAAIPGGNISKDQTGQEEILASAAILQYRYAYAHVSQIPSKMTATALKGGGQSPTTMYASPDIQAAPSGRKFRKARFAPKMMTATEKGIATHLFMQYAAYDVCTSLEGIDQELRRMVREDFMTEEQASAVQQEEVLTFFLSELGRWLLRQERVKREFKFSLLVDAGLYDVEAAGEEILMQGVVDCFVLEDDGITILDFKTDHVNGSCQVKAEGYRMQMEAYADALSGIYGLPVKKCLLYFFAANQEVEINLN